MSEWWTYRLTDFLMYSPRTFARMVEAYNRDLWPGPLIALSAGLLSLWLARAGTASSGRVLAALLALAWGWVAWAFHAQRHATIFTGGTALAGVFALQAVLLAGIAAAPSTGREMPSVGARMVGWTLAILGILGWPLLAPAFGRPWAQAQVFGWMPDPTALATWGLLLASGLRVGRVPRWLPSAVPVLAVLSGVLILMVQNTSAAR